MSRANLSRRGFLERREDEHDRRLKRVRLTADGRELVSQMLATRLQSVEAWVATLDEEHRVRLHEALSPLLEDLTGDRP